MAAAANDDLFSGEDDDLCTYSVVGVCPVPACLCFLFSRLCAGFSQKTICGGAGIGMEDFDVPLLEKYRPRTLDDVVGNSALVGEWRAIFSAGFTPPSGVFTVCWFGFGRDARQKRT